jgi:hypothetical protein
MNKKGFGGMLLFFVILFAILIIGFMMAMMLGAIDFASDTVTPVMEDLGVVGSTNMSQVSEFTFGAADTVVQALPWVTGFLLVVALIFSVIFAVYYPTNPSPVFIGVYLLFVILLIFGSIVMSNMYEDIYTGDDEIATRLQDQTLTSFIMLRSPLIFGIIAMITGIYLFTKSGEGAGGFGV